MVSAMLTAIQDFAQDSFKQSEQATLDSLQMNELAVWIERSPDLVLAAVIRGNAPLKLRQMFDEPLNRFNLDKSLNSRNLKAMPRRLIKLVRFCRNVCNFKQAKQRFAEFLNR